MMNLEQIRERVMPIIRDIVEPYDAVVIDHIHDDMNLFTDLHYDSLHAVEFVMQLEEEFGIEISDDTANDVQTVGDAILVICEKHGVTYVESGRR